MFSVDGPGGARLTPLQSFLNAHRPVSSLACRYPCLLPPRFPVSSIPQDTCAKMEDIDSERCHITCCGGYGPWPIISRKSLTLCGADLGFGPLVEGYTSGLVGYQLMPFRLCLLAQVHIPALSDLKFMKRRSHRSL